MLRTLIWKDVLVNRPVLWFAAAIAVSSFGFPFMIAAIDTELLKQTFPRRLYMVFATGSLACHMTSQLSLAILAANLFAVEREDRSAEFLAYLPVCRSANVKSKLTVYAATALILFLVTLLMATVAVVFGEPHENLYKIGDIPAAYISAGGFGIAGIGWFFSSFLKSNAVAILLTFVTAWVLCFLVVTIIIGVLGVKNQITFQAFYFVNNLAVGFTGFFCGTRIYLKRVEP